MALKKQIKETKAAEVKAAAETKEEVKKAVKAAEDKPASKQFKGSKNCSFFMRDLQQKMTGGHRFGAQFYRSKNSVFFIGRYRKIGLI